MFRNLDYLHQSHVYTTTRQKHHSILKMYFHSLTIWVWWLNLKKTLFISDRISNECKSTLSARTFWSQDCILHMKLWPSAFSYSSMSPKVFTSICKVAAESFCAPDIQTTPGCISCLCRPWMATELLKHNLKKIHKRKLEWYKNIEEGEVALFKQLDSAIIW